MKGSKPLIGLNADYRSAKKDAPAFSYLCAGYYDCVTKAGGIPIIIPPLADEEDLDHVLDMLDGVVLVGGADLDPRRDGFMLHPTVRPLESRREDFDRLLMHADRRPPHAAVGHRRGHAVAQRLAGRQPVPARSRRTCPRRCRTRTRSTRPIATRLEVVPGTLMERVYGDGEIRVNSMHHMAVDEVAPGFMVSARCPDGVVEAIESTHARLVRHRHAVPSRRPKRASALDLRIFEEFIDGVKAASGQVEELRLVA